MRTLITNLKGQCLFNASMETQAEGVIILSGKHHRKTELDKFIKGGEIIIETEDPIEICKRISEIIKGAKKHGEIFIAYGGESLGSLLNFVANKESVNAIFSCYNDKIIRIPVLKLDISNTRQKILEFLSYEDLSAAEIGKNADISRAMVYKHLAGLMDMGLVEKSRFFEKYAITRAGRLVII
ncbi:MAG: ArsR family transcriptional regulator [Methanobacterium sp.]|uniref:ArsR family transcriptional regulator n=1 Tax=Methanobacterium sp. TaxID=2164 RepID=UPI003D6612C7|nr:ArsR family transcriptional regulator [Methanobacterium sp.]